MDRRKNKKFNLCPLLALVRYGMLLKLLLDDCQSVALLMAGQTRTDVLWGISKEMAANRDKKIRGWEKRMAAHWLEYVYRFSVCPIYGMRMESAYGLAWQESLTGYHTVSAVAVLFFLSIPVFFKWDRPRIRWPVP